MRRTITTAALAAALLLTGCSSYSAEDCQKAITNESTKTNRPTECQGLSQDDYDALLLNWALEKGLSEMDPKDRDILDYYDDGSVNDSIGGDD